MTILCYHAIDPEWRSPLAVTPAAFADQMTWLAAHRQVLDPSTAASRINRSGLLPRGTTAITFDDGFKSVHELALPVLRRLGLPAMVFVVAETLTADGRAVDWVDTPPSWPLATVTAEEAKELDEAGIRVASHSYSHQVLTELSDAECEADLRRSRDILEEVVGHPVTEIAYPRGFHDERVQRAARRAGFDTGFALPESPERPGPMAIPRVGIYPGNDTRSLRIKLSRTYLPLRTGRAYPLLRRLVRGAPPPTRRAG